MDVGFDGTLSRGSFGVRAPIGGQTDRVAFTPVVGSVDRLRLIADKVAGTDALGVESNSTLQAEKVVEMLNDFEGGVDMYVFYRYLCGFTHTSTVLTDEYMNFDHSPDSIGYEFLNEPKSDLARSTHVHAVVTSTLWALSAVRFIYKDKSVHKDKMRALRSQLQSAANNSEAPLRSSSLPKRMPAKKGSQ